MEIRVIQVRQSMKAIALFCLLATPAARAEELQPGKESAPLAPEKAVQAMKLPDGFTSTLVAAEPDVVQPVSFCIDDRGRILVAEALNYGAWLPTGKDRVVILEDTDGDGRADSRKVFYEGFNYITGIEVGFGGVWVLSPPRLYFVPDRDRDDEPDGPPEVLFDGFGYKESRHNLANGFTWGPDGWLYAGHGRTSPSDVGRPGTPSEERIHCDGGVYRIHPTRLLFENFADGTTNPWGVDFDDYGQCFVSNCVNPHLFHMIQGGHYEPWRSRPSSMYAYERLPTIADHLHYAGGVTNSLGSGRQVISMRGETPETLAMGGGHAHCGTLVYLGDTFPESFRNTVFMCNVHGRRINHDLLKRKGSGYTAQHGKDLMISGDPWFMGVTLRTGPDGSIFVSDWSDTGECHTYKPKTTTGRIYKISYGKPRTVQVDLARLSDDELVQLHLHKNDWHVRHARRLLQERGREPGWNGDPVHQALRKMLASHPDTARRLRALWTLHATGGLSAEHLFGLLRDSSEHVRAWAIQLLCEDGKPSQKTLKRFAAMAYHDPSPVVRLYLACALQRLPMEDRWAIADGLVSHVEDADDANLPLMYWYGIEPLVPEDSTRAVGLAARSRVPLVRRFLARRFIDAQTEKKNNLDPLVEALGKESESVSRELLEGIREGLRGRKDITMPTGWPAVYARLRESEDRVLRDHAVVVALAFNDPQALDDLRRVAESRVTPTEQRQAALTALIDRRTPGLAPRLHNLLDDEAMRPLALRGLAAYDHEATPRLVLMRYPKLTTAEKQDALATLASRKSYVLALLDAIEKKAVPPGDISAYLARQLYLMNDKTVTDRLRKVWGDVRERAPEKQDQIARYRKMLSPGFMKKADLANGRLIYSKTCQQCHLLHGEGGKIGPDLTGSNRTNLDYLLANMVDPSAEIGRDYRMSLVETKDGRVLTGIFIERTPNRMILQTATDQHILAPGEIDTLTDSSLSMMPEGQLDVLSKEEVRDLIAYLGSTKQVPFEEP